ncbi:N-acetylmuramoyl-L-alanine amidase [Flavobacterium algicola]|uniref:N-acetylmuramoyl-L-alanine amidase n=1 Tax=Flavobacterium algicola TaxID=556529 RepID=UPI001EFD0EE6|nr:N-acetylmuramoyl-L-alanine amidase [Flavobacterium algicola]MCG9793347.1 N-acetylmuramoyl-L-alanine amidase [Flavobacterium algicola]
MKKSLFSVVLALIIVSCGTKNPYKETDKVYKEKVKVLKEQIDSREPKPLPVVTKTVISIDTSYTKVLYKFSETITDVGTKTLNNGQETKWIGTVNFNLRKPNLIILHHTAQDSIEQTIKTFTLTRTQVSAHYVIGDDGKVVQMLNDYLRAWHAGNGSWGKIKDINSSSIGIELDNNGFEPFSEAQISSLMALLTRLKSEFGIPRENIIGHSDIAPSRKVDPSPLFPWKTLAENGFGLWLDEIAPVAPFDFNIEQGLRIIGYDTTNLNAAIMAFKRHFIQTETDSTLDQKTINAIYNIYLKS